MAAGVTFFEPTTSASRSRRSSAMTAMPRFGFCATSEYAVTCAPACVSALKSVVFPELGRPTMPTRSATSLYASKPTRVSRAKRLT